VSRRHCPARLTNEKGYLGAELAEFSARVGNALPGIAQPVMPLGPCAGRGGREESLRQLGARHKLAPGVGGHPKLPGDGGAAKQESEGSRALIAEAEPCVR